jgi:hypothetical protein
VLTAPSPSFAAGGRGVSEGGGGGTIRVGALPSIFGGRGGGIGPFAGRGGSVIRTVSFFGCFDSVDSAIAGIKSLPKFALVVTRQVKLAVGGLGFGSGDQIVAPRRPNRSRDEFTDRRGPGKDDPGIDIGRITFGPCN